LEQMAAYSVGRGACSLDTKKGDNAHVKSK